MHIIIPTRGRVGRQQTLIGLPEKWRKRTVLVCPKDEMAMHAKIFPGQLCNIIAQPDPKMTIAAKRAWIFKNCPSWGMERILMMDDDLRFSVRLKQHVAVAGFYGADKKKWEAILEKDSAAGALTKVTPADYRLDAMFRKIDYMLDIFEHGGIGPRQMNHTKPGEWEMNSRAMYALAFNVKTLLKHCQLGRIQHREDMDYTLQLFRAGFANAVYTWGAVDQAAGYGNTKGGTQGERTIAASDKDAALLAKLHPGLVRVVDRSYKGSVARKEVVVSWKKAAEKAT